LVLAGIIWYQQYKMYHCQYGTGIVMVLPQYSTDGFMCDWYRHDTDSGDLQKTLMLYNFSPIFSHFSKKKFL
jgi:hypothetical protein